MQSTGAHSSARVLVLAAGHGVMGAELLAQAQGAALPTLASRGAWQLLQQLRAASGGAARLPPCDAGEVEWEQRPASPAQRQASRPFVAQAQPKLDRPWHRQQDPKEEWQRWQEGLTATHKQREEARVNGANGQGPSRPMRDRQQSGNAARPSQAPHPRGERTGHAPAQQQAQPGQPNSTPRPQPLRPSGLAKPRFLLERATQQQQQEQQGQGGQQRRRPANVNGQAAARREPNGWSNGEQRLGGWARSERERNRQQQQHQQQAAMPRERQAPQQPMAWWQKQRLAKQEAATAGEQQQQRWQGARGGQGPQRQQQQQQAPAEEAAPQQINVPAEVSMIRLAALLGTSVEDLDPVLRELGEAPSSEQDIVSPDAVELAALEFGKVAVVERDSASLDADAVPRPAVVTVMGHVDHGKTTLLDALRSTSVAAHEAGGITQHIGAFEVQMPGSKASLTFLDTPGHAAFSSMRARGAAVTDLVVLVVAADDGVMPQTLEAIAHARAAGCPIVVAITKCDMPNADPARVRQQLIGQALELEEVGGNVQVIEVAAKAGLGLEELEDALLLQAELLELKASRSRRAEGTVIEAKMDKGQGPVATVVVKRGTLKVGQVVVVGSEWGKVRSLRGTGGKAAAEVLPGQPAEISGLRGLPQAGDELLVVANEERAQRMSRARTSRSEFHRRAAIVRLVAVQQAREQEAAGEGEDGTPVQRVMPVVVKADVQGSAEAVRDAISTLSSEQVRVQVVHVGVGPISLSDINMAVPLGAKVLGFNVRPSGADVETLAKQHGLDIRCQRVIYHLLEDVSNMVVGASPKVEHEVVVGSAEVLQIFGIKGSRGKLAAMVAGCRVTDGSIRSALRYRVLRGGEVVFQGPCASLRRHKLDVETVGKGTECGVGLEGFDGFKLGDVLQCVDVELRAAEVKATPPAGAQQHQYV